MSNISQATGTVLPPTTFNGTYEVHHILPVDMFNNETFGRDLRIIIGGPEQVQSHNNRIAMFTDLESAKIYKQLQIDHPELKEI